jgi:RNA polymerase sigma-54 factor
MRFDTSQFMKMGQQMKLGPHMIQSMEILQMSMAELQERIDQELESNATLEVAEGSELDAGAELELRRDGGDEAVASRDDAPLAVGDASGRDDFERLEQFEADNPDAAENAHQSDDARDDRGEERLSEREYEPGSSSGSGDEDAKGGALANHAARGEAFTDQLLDQWRYADVKAELKPLGEMIIAHIEEDGYLRTSLETIAGKARVAVDAARLGQALQAVQLLLEPSGIGARDVRECLLLQIDAREDAAEVADLGRWELARQVVEGHLEDLKNNRLPKIAQKLGVEMARLKDAVGLLRQLKLSPGRELTSEAATGIIPDAIVEYSADQDRYVVYLNDRRLPNLRINQEYALLAKDRSAPKPTREFLKTNMNNAAFLIDAIAQRKRTLLRVLEAVVEAQRDFFDYGPQAIRPLAMTSVAEKLGIHVATVSRAVAEKWVQTPRGVVSLRKFFTGGTGGAGGAGVAGGAAGGAEEGVGAPVDGGGGEGGVSWEAIKAALLQIVEQEDKRNPLSDDQLAEALKSKGLDIARRTVAKYRGQLNIPTGRLRKEH